MSAIPNQRSRTDCYPTFLALSLSPDCTIHDEIGVGHNRARANLEDRPTISAKLGIVYNDVIGYLPGSAIVANPQPSRNQSPPTSLYYCTWGCMGAWRFKGGLPSPNDASFDTAILRAEIFSDSLRVDKNKCMFSCPAVAAIPLVICDIHISWISAKFR